MTTPIGHILVVDDNKINRMVLERLLRNQGHQVSQVEDGALAVAYLMDPENDPVDVVLLDILMPELDGYEVLERIKSDSRFHHLPVIMTSALDELDSVVRCIEIGATDYLTKPVQPALLKARLNASLAEKRLRDLEIEYLEQVGIVVDAAEAVESNLYDPERLADVAKRADALGNLARVFQRMAKEVHLREQRLRQQLTQLRLDIEEMQKALAEPIHVYMPMDRRQAVAAGEDLPDRAAGSALFADISGFTPMTEALAREHGHHRGPEEITRLINQIFTMQIEEVHAFRGSVINFSGDAITCWFEGDDGIRAVACGLYMQSALMQFQDTMLESGSELKPGIKVAVVSGPARRFLVGNPEIQWVEALAGETINLLAEAEENARRGELVIDAGTMRKLEGRVAPGEWRGSSGSDRFVVIRSLLTLAEPDPWPALPEGALPDEACRPWLLPAIYKRVRSSSRQFLAELRPAAALFFKFEGIDYDRDEAAGEKLNRFISWVQSIVDEFDGSLLQVTFGDKGSYLYASFGAPVAHPDDGVRAVRAAMRLLELPPGMDFVYGLQAGVASGQMRAGGYGSGERRTYGVLGTRVNIAARLMQAAAGAVLVDESVYQAARNDLAFEVLPALQVKGSEQPVPVFRPTGLLGEKKEESALLVKNLIDQLDPGDQLGLKLASILGEHFTSGLLAAVFEEETGRIELQGVLARLEQSGLIRRSLQEGFIFRDEQTWQVAYDSLLFAQRRQLHRRYAEWLENSPEPVQREQYATLAGQWQAAEEADKAIHYFELAGKQALENGEPEKAEQFLQAGLQLEARR